MKVLSGSNDIGTPTKEMEPYKCTVCGRTFTQKSGLKVHLRIHTGEKPFQCETCGRGFSRKYVLRIHERTHTGEKPFLCSQCGKGFVQQIHLKNHERTHVHKKRLQETEVPLQDLSSSIIPGHECDICHSYFASLEAMTRHRKSHPHMLPDRRHKCSLCSYSTDVSTHMKDHLMKHGKVKLYKCKFCHEAFVQKSGLEQHVLVHSEEKPFVCKTCGRGFSQKIHLRNHEGTHIREKPFFCFECGRGFSRPDCMRKHEATHMAQEPEISGKIFDHECDICHSHFASLAAMTRHRKCHQQVLQDKRHKCSVCSYSTDHSTHLKKHSMVHSKLKPYKCMLCGKTFSQNSNLTSHLLRLHGNRVSTENDVT